MMPYGIISMKGIKDVMDHLDIRYAWSRSPTVILFHSGIRFNRFLITTEIEAIKNDDDPACFERIHRAKTIILLEQYTRFQIENVNHSLTYQFGTQI